MLKLLNSSKNTPQTMGKIPNCAWTILKLVHTRSLLKNYTVLHLPCANSKSVNIIQPWKNICLEICEDYVGQRKCEEAGDKQVQPHHFRDVISHALDTKMLILLSVFVGVMFVVISRTYHATLPMIVTKTVRRNDDVPDSIRCLKKIQRDLAAAVC